MKSHNSRFASDSRLVASTRKVYVTHQRYKRTGNSTLGKELGIITDAEAAAYQLCYGVVEDLSTEWSKLLQRNSNPVKQEELLRFLSSQVTHHRHLGWRLPSIHRHLARPTAVSVALLEPQQLTAVAAAIGGRYCADIERSIKMPRRRKKEARRAAEESLVRSLCAFRYFRAAQHNGHCEAEFVTLASSLLGS